MAWILILAGVAVFLVGLFPVLTPIRFVKGGGYHRASWLLAAVGAVMIACGWLLSKG